MLMGSMATGLGAAGGFVAGSANVCVHQVSGVLAPSADLSE